MELPRSNRLSRFLRRVAAFAAVVGPGLITGVVDNDAGGIATCSMAGSYFGYSVLWLYIPITIALIVVMEMCSRMAVATGKGLSDLIRENYGVRATFYMMLALLFANWAVTVSEFSGIAASLQLLGIPHWVSVPGSALTVWWIVNKGNYRMVERVFLVSLVFYLAYPISAAMARPDWGLVLAQFVRPAHIPWSPVYLVFIVGIIGTTITPWMLFYLQSSTVEKGVRPEDYPLTKWDVIIGCVVSDLLSIFIVVACAATLFVHGIRVEKAGEAALALAPFAGRFSTLLFGAGLFMASLLGAAILPLSTAYYICEGMGWETGIDRSFEEAPQFYWLFGLMIAAGAAVLLFVQQPLFKVMLAAQVVNGVILPFILIFMLRLVNKKEIMKEHTNSPLYNFIAWTTVCVLIGLTLLMVLTTFQPPTQT